MGLLRWTAEKKTTSFFNFSNKKFTVQLSDRDLIFHQSQKSKRWWVEIVIKSYLDNKIKSNTLLSCTYEDYLNACDDKLPERWIKASRRL